MSNGENFSKCQKTKKIFINTHHPFLFFRTMESLLKLTEKDLDDMGIGLLVFKIIFLFSF